MHDLDYSSLDGICRDFDILPKITDPFYLELYPIGVWMRDALAKYAKGRLLDYGSGCQPYRDWALLHVESYLAADVVETRGVTTDIKIKPNEPLDLESESFDTVLSSQVLEHVAEAQLYVNESARILRKGGVLILTAPMQWRHHENGIDFWRYTRYGLNMMLERAGFEIVESVPGGGAFRLIGQVFLSYMVSVHWPRRNISQKRLWPRIVISTINRFFAFVDDRISDDDETLTWMVVARKRG